MLGTKVLEERKSKFNGSLRVLKTLGMGTYIQAGGLTQSGGIVQTIWKQTIRQIKVKRQEVKDVLILGLGGGTVAKLIRKTWPEAEITGVEIDPLMTELGKKYLELGEVGVEIKIGDAINELDSIKKKFDLVIIDLYNGDEYPEKFGKDSFINSIKRNLAKGGVTVFNRLYYGDKRPEAVKFGNKLEKIFSKVDWFYPEANLIFICS